MHREQPLDALELNDEVTPDDEVSPEVSVHDLAVVDHGDPNVAPVREPTLGEFVRETGGVRRLEQTRPKHSMHLHCRLDDLMRFLVSSHALRPLRLCVSAVQRRMFVATEPAASPDHPARH
jgi:inhibitor of KinA sporulation pathway (predicted exonuclease)